MPADETYDVAHDKNKKTSDDKPGCYNHGHYADGYYAPDRVYKPDGTFYIVQTYIKRQFINRITCPNADYAECKGCDHGHV